MIKKYLSILLLITTYIAIVIAQEAEHDHDHDHADHDHPHEEAIAAEGDAHAGHDHDHAGHNHGPTSLEDCVAVTTDYNLGLRIGAIFIIMAATMIGVFAPIILHRIRPYSQHGVRYWILTISKFFGTGVILAVAFIHMIPEAIMRFESPCIVDDWTSYHGFVGVFALIAVFFIQIVELAILSHVEKKHTNQDTNSNDDTTAANKDIETGSVVKGGSNTHVDGHTHMMIENSKDMRDVSTIVLELGIVIHSIIIGLTLGFSSNEGFTALFIALVFHQFFEGLALGTRINEMEHKNYIKPLIMGLIFSLTTPVGVAIGIGVNLTVNPFSQSSVLGQAILDSLAAGILLYNAFISLIAGEINHNAAFRRSSLPYKAICFLSLYIGAALMALLGKWA
ncbi:ZIP zinc transporter-domain-containing protein [Phascolomyces articulosus]|uniref:ZIP zinc transporter-domain-containing protein n=1 Tax=Phascolomyces articulosus TaxID=60185 RepID=A0AAD5KF99_9FUNG|nr:ZIP zinc transporter-domain-containing protein [Phascolomyces articulosus]